MCMALCPIRSGKRLRNNDSMNSLLVLSNNDDVILGRQQLLPCLYSACGCDDNIGSTQNKCGACQLTNEWAIQALSRKLLLFSKSGKLYGRGKHASILVNSKPLLFNVEGKGEWQGGEEIQAGSLLSLMPVEGEGILEFEVVSIDSATNEIMEKLVEDSAENHHPILSPSPMKTQEFHLDKGMRFQDDTDNSDNFMGGEEPPGPSSECMTSRTYHYDDIACRLESRNCLSDPSVSCGELLSNSVDSDSSLKRADLPIPRFAFRESNTQEISIRETQTEIGLDPAAINNSESKARAGEDIIEKRDSNTQVISNINASGHQDATENQTESCPESAIDYLKSKEKVEKVMTKSLESRGLVLFFCPLGQDLPEKRRKLLSEKAVSLGATVTDSFLSATHLIVSEHTSSLDQVSKRLGVKESVLKAHIDTVRLYLFTNQVQIVFSCLLNALA